MISSSDWLNEKGREEFPGLFLRCIRSILDDKLPIDDHSRSRPLEPAPNHASIKYIAASVVILDIDLAGSARSMRRLGAFSVTDFLVVALVADFFAMALVVDFADLADFFATDLAILLLLVWGSI